MAQLETKKLFVRNLDRNLTEEQVQQFFAQFGEIASVKLPLDKFGRKRGFGFVEYVNEGDAEKAIAEANEKTIAPSDRIINVSMAEERERKPFGERGYGDRGGHAHHDRPAHQTIELNTHGSNEEDSDMSMAA